jgi:hypothetical protein
LAKTNFRFSQDEMTTDENEKINLWQFGYSKTVLTLSPLAKSNRRSVSRDRF